MLNDRKLLHGVCALQILVFLDRLAFHRGEVAGGEGARERRRERARERERRRERVRETERERSGKHRRTSLIKTSVLRWILRTTARFAQTDSGRESSCPTSQRVGVGAGSWLTEAPVSVSSWQVIHLNRNSHKTPRTSGTSGAAGSTASLRPGCVAAPTAARLR